MYNIIEHVYCHKNENVFPAIGILQEFYISF